MKKLSFVALISCLIAGCATQVTPLMPVLTTDADRPYTPISDLNSQVFFGGLFDEGTPEDMCLDKMRREAFAQRADALIFVRYGERGYDGLLRRVLRCSSRAVRYNAV